MRKFTLFFFLTFLFTIFIVLLSSFLFIFSNETYQTQHAKVELFFNLKIQPVKAKLLNATSIIHIKEKAEKDSVFFSFEPKYFDFSNPIAEHQIKEKYLEYYKYPKISFKGYFFDKIDYNNHKKQTLKVKGVLTMKNIKREEEIPVNITLHDKDIKMHTEFMLEASNYGILDEEHKFKDSKDNINIKLDATYKIKQ